MFTVKQAVRHVSRMIELEEAAARSNMDFYLSEYDRAALEKLAQSEQTFSKRIAERVEEYQMRK